MAETEVQARKTGKALDDLSGPRIARQMENQAREMRVMGQESDATARKVDSTEQSMRQLEQRATGVTQETRKARLELGALGKALGLLKWPAIITGIGGAIQALGGLSAGVVALLPKLTDLAGLGAGVGATYLGLGETMGVVKLATSGLSQALAGNKQALQSLTPEGRAFLQTLKQMRPELQQLRSVAQQGLFPGLGGLLGSVRAQMPQIKGIVGTVAGDAGNLGGFIGQQIAQPGFMRDLQSLADQGSRAFGGAARGAFSFGTALEQILIAAAPFTDWLSSAVDHLGQVAAQEALVARATGSMGDFFDRAKQSVQTLADVGKNVFGGLLGVLEAARGSGDSLWGSIDRVARRFDQWTNS